MDLPALASSLNGSSTEGPNQAIRDSANVFEVAETFSLVDGGSNNVPVPPVPPP